MNISINETFEKQEDGTMKLVHSEIVENAIQTQTQEELIAEKEAELLRVYAEIQTLKDANI
jgi:hypothetical protein